MSYRSILVQAEDSDAGRARLAAATALARAAGGRLIGVGAFEYALITDPNLGFAGAEAIAILWQEIDSDLQRAEAVFRAGAKAAGVQALWRRSTDSPASAMADEARGADVVVASRSSGADRRFWADPGDLVMMAGLPVLVIPPGMEAVSARCALIAWKNTRETRRAVTESLPLLKQAERVVVAAVQEGEDAGRLKAEAEDVAERLRLQGVSADVDLVPRIELSVADELLAVAESRKADLIVAGAYGHSRLREWVFGGVTDRLLSATPVPALLAR